MIRLNAVAVPIRLLQAIALSGLCLLIAPSLGADDLTGDWSLTLDSGTPAWMSIGLEDGQPKVLFRLYVGSKGPHQVVEAAPGRLVFQLRQNRKAQDSKQVEVELRDGRLVGAVVTTTADGKRQRDPFTGKRIPPPPKQRPDLSRVRFGHPKSLFNGRDLDGWRPHESDKINGWSVREGLLVNSTPKTDFRATGDHANLRTEATFEDFWLHLEFQVEENRNSGVYLRGMYEAQVVDRDSRMQGIQGPGAIFGEIKPTKNAGLPGGAWQTYDLTLVDRHITVVLNGETVIDNQPIAGPTAGAILTDPTRSGPIYLQGDHTQVKYRNIYLAPVISDE